MGNIILSRPRRADSIVASEMTRHDTNCEEIPDTSRKPERKISRLDFGPGGGFGGISLLPGCDSSQQLEAWLRVPGEDDVLRRAKDPVADDHLDFEGKPGTESEE